MNEEKVFKEIIEKLKCLMSDRAAVMKSFDSKMAVFKNELLGKESSTYFIFCNAHFLLGLSTAASVAAKVVEDELKATCTKLGRDASTSFNTFTSVILLRQLPTQLFAQPLKFLGLETMKRAGAGKNGLHSCHLKARHLHFQAFAATGLTTSSRMPLHYCITKMMS
ncbi:hypothetical protein PoB_006837400 [Plakobranchus ocellatus]|uniref:Uncharacterized protein n=1 Tax=Plakobranchus ocellatus TaxID=259542 RepID=A0AAV4DCE4_9GAST|nr:hypothetical protein PoB_006837400 [Plakobranchus ocellatus]